MNSLVAAVAGSSLSWLTLMVIGLASMHPVSGSDEQLQPGVPQIAVDELLRRSLEAQGGIGALDRIRTLKLTGTMVTPPVSEGGGQVPKDLKAPAIPVTLYVKQPDRVRMDLLVEGKSTTAVYDPAMPDSPGMEALINAILKQISELTRSLAGPAPSAKLELVGKERVNNREVYRLKRREASGDNTYIFVDSTQFTRVKQSEIYRGLDLDTYFDDYKRIGSVLIPHSIEYKAYGDQTFSKLTIEKVEINEPLDDSLFTKPVKQQN